MISKNAIEPFLKAVPYILALGIGVIWFLVYHHDAKKAIEKSKIDFPILTYEQSLTAMVIEVYCPQEVRCSTPPVLTILDDNRKISIDAREDIENKFTFLSIISVGDSLAKKEDSDTLFVFENGKVSRFLIK